MNVRFLKSAPALVVMAIALPAAALDLTVAQFGQAMFGAPFAVARVKGFFKEVGIDVTGFIARRRTAWRRT